MGKGILEIKQCKIFVMFLNLLLNMFRPSIFYQFKSYPQKCRKIIVSVALLGNNKFQFSILFFSAATKVTSETITNTNLCYFATKKKKINRFFNSTSTIFVHFKSWTDKNYIRKSILKALNKCF